MTETNTPRLKTMVLFLIGTIVLGIIVNLLSETLKPTLIEILGKKYSIWLWGLLGVFVMLYLFVEFYSKKTPSNKKSTQLELKEARKELIKGTLKRYQSRREQKLTSDVNFEIDLQLSFIPTKTKDKVQKQFVIKPHQNKISAYEELFKLYYREIRRLLILGEPGSGKTMLLLRFAEFLMYKAIESDLFPVPIIVNLASWRSDEPVFEEWLEKQLTHSAGQLGISREYAGELMKGNQIIILLDGLDEIPENHRDSVLDDLSQYLMNKQRKNEIAAIYPEVIICSRIKEFKSLEATPYIYGTVVIAPLTQKKVKETIEELSRKNNLAARRLLVDFKNHKLLRQALDTAFYVHTALSLYSTVENPVNKILTVSTKEELQDQLLEVYLQQQLKLIDYTSNKARHWLGWLATGLQKSKKGVSFELADLQINWLGNNRIYNFIFWFVFGLAFGLVFGVIFSLISGSTLGLAFGLATGLVFGLVFGLVGGLVGSLVRDPSFINYRDIIYYNWENLTLLLFIKESLLYGLIYGLVYGLVGGLVFSLLFGLLKGLVFGLIFGLVIGLTFGLFNIISENKRFSKVEEIFQRLTTDLKDQVIKWTFIGSLTGLLLKLQPWSSEWIEMLSNFSYPLIILMWCYFWITY